nr:hypothetical protein [Tanacetum cinerariifolium]
MNSSKSDSDEGIKIKTYTELTAVAKSEKFDDFGILINLKAPVTKESLNSRTPIDLVTMLDISISMKDSKIALLKQAMGFVVQNLGPLDRLSVISFSSARCVFPLRQMTEIGKQESLQMINSLVADGMTNIDEALKKGSKVMTDRKFKNPVSGMIFLSDDQETCNSGQPLTLSNTRIPIHTFGFWADHDANLLHSISEQSGGIFSFIEAENVIQDAFAQCIAGSYKVGMDSNGRWGFIEVGDLYAEEERDFLVSMDIPVNEADNEMPLVKFRVIHKDPIKNTFVTTEGNEVTILRPETVGNQTVSLEVDRQRNRLNVASAIAEARLAAEHGNLSEARLMLRGCQRKLSESAYYHEDEM